MHDQYCSNHELCPYMGECREQSTFLIEGGLADRVRQRLGKTDDVFIVESGYRTGYSEYTITSEWRAFTIKCGDVEVHFTNPDDDWGDDFRVLYDYKTHQDITLSPIDALVKWLDQT